MRACSSADRVRSSYSVQSFSILGPSACPFSMCSLLPGVRLTGGAKGGALGIGLPLVSACACMWVSFVHCDLWVLLRDTWLCVLPACGDAPSAPLREPAVWAPRLTDLLRAAKARGYYHLQRISRPAGAAVYRGIWRSPCGPCADVALKVLAGRTADRRREAAMCRRIATAPHPHVLQVAPADESQGNGSRGKGSAVDGFCAAGGHAADAMAHLLILPSSSSSCAVHPCLCLLVVDLFFRGP